MRQWARVVIIFILCNGYQLLQQAAAQCAMCRATMENNVSTEDIGIGAGINFGILYLFVMPYLAVMVIGFLWYRKSKANAKKIELAGRFRRKMS